MRVIDPPEVDMPDLRHEVRGCHHIRTEWSGRHSVGAVSTAPDQVRFCASCAAPMATADVHGVARRVCSGCQAVHYATPKVAVGVAVFRDDRLLLVRRVMQPGRGRWTVPGGFLDAGEDPRAAAAREVAEE